MHFFYVHADSKLYSFSTNDQFYHQWLSGNLLPITVEQVFQNSIYGNQQFKMTVFIGTTTIRPYFRMHE